MHLCNGVIDCCNGSDEEDLKDNPSYLAASLAAKSLQKSFLNNFIWSWLYVCQWYWKAHKVFLLLWMLSCEIICPQQKATPSVGKTYFTCATDYLQHMQTSRKSCVSNTSSSSSYDGANYLIIIGVNISEDCIKVRLKMYFPVNGYYYSDWSLLYENESESENISGNGWWLQLIVWRVRIGESFEWSLGSSTEEINLRRKIGDLET